MTNCRVFGALRGACCKACRLEAHKEVLGSRDPLQCDPREAGAAAERGEEVPDRFTAHVVDEDVTRSASPITSPTRSTVPSSTQGAGSAAL